MFGSEIKALLAFPGMQREADLSALDQYLTWGYVPTPDTAFLGIRKLPAAHYLVVDAHPDGGLGSPELVCYWRLPAPSRAPRDQPAAELRSELVARLEEAVRLRLVSDVPLGAFLSGGIDSSAVVATMARVGSERHASFSKSGKLIGSAAYYARRGNGQAADMPIPSLCSPTRTRRIRTIRRCGNS